MTYKLVFSNHMYLKKIHNNNSEQLLQFLMYFKIICTATQSTTPLTLELSEIAACFNLFSQVSLISGKVFYYFIFAFTDQAQLQDTGVFNSVHLPDLVFD